jgi:bifunctional DNA-binding transcriptional regulator/antitoxin component of YhaV-PrlF toxin-antitoxin module
MNTSNRWTITVEQDDFSKDYYFILPDELLEKMEWKVGDTLKMDIIKMGIDRSLQITKKTR